MNLEVGSSIPGGYRLTESLGTVGWFISTWRARDAHGDDVVLRFHHTRVADENGPTHDLREKVGPLCPRFDRVMKAPTSGGLAPWLRYAYDPDEGYLFMVRRFYNSRLDMRFLPARAGEGGAPRKGLLTAFQQLAEGLDALCQHQVPFSPYAIHQDNMFLVGTQAVLVDYGCEELKGMIETGYAGTRPADPRVQKRAVELVFLGRIAGSDQERAQAALAAAYFRIR